MNKKDKYNLMKGCIDLRSDNSLVDDVHDLRYFLKVLSHLFPDKYRENIQIENWLQNCSVRYEEYQQVELRYKFRYLINKLYFEDVDLNWEYKSFKNFSAFNILHEFDE